MRMTDGIELETFKTLLSVNSLLQFFFLILSDSK